MTCGIEALSRRTAWRRNASGEGLIQGEYSQGQGNGQGQKCGLVQKVHDETFGY